VRHTPLQVTESFLDREKLAEVWESKLDKRFIYLFSYISAKILLNISHKMFWSRESLSLSCGNCPTLIIYIKREITYFSRRRERPKSEFVCLWF